MNTATMSAEAKKDKPATGRPRMRGRNKALLIIGSLLLMAIFRTGFMFIIIGMMPSIVMYYMDVSRKRYMYKTVFACNLAGMVPFIGKMLDYGPSSSVMEDIMGDASNWIIIYASAFLGWMTVRVTPIVAAMMIGGFHGTQVMRLKGNQKRIEVEWGQEVTQFSKKPDEDDDL